MESNEDLEIVWKIPRNFQIERKKEVKKFSFILDRLKKIKKQMLFNGKKIR